MKKLYFAFIMILCASMIQCMNSNQVVIAQAVRSNQVAPLPTPVVQGQHIAQQAQPASIFCCMQMPYFRRNTTPEVTITDTATTTIDNDNTDCSCCGSYCNTRYSVTRTTSIRR